MHLAASTQQTFLQVSKSESANSIDGTPHKVEHNQINVMVSPHFITGVQG